MILFIVINSIILFVLMQVLGVPLSNLAVINFQYDTFSFSKDKTTSGMNIIYNMFLPNIYMLLIYEFVEDVQIKKSVYFIVLGYLFIRYFFIIFILNRYKLLNLKYEGMLILLTLASTYIINANIIEKDISIKIPIEEFKNEIVLLVILFLYSIFKSSLINNFDNRNNTSDRKKYIRFSYIKFLDKYAKNINNQIDKLKYFSKTTEIEKKEFKLLVYSFMIYENFSRPRFYRIVENTFSKMLKKEHSTGVMQIKGQLTYTDEESISIGIKILIDSFSKYYVDENMYGDMWIDKICEDYNPQDGNEYINEVKYIFYELKTLTLS